MSKWFDPVVVYGIFDNQRDHVLKWEWLDEHFPNVDIYASCIVRLHVKNAIYGIQCHLDEQGQTVPPDKGKMQELNRLLEAMRKTDDNKDATLEYHLAIDGDWETEQDTYVLPLAD